MNELISAIYHQKTNYVCRHTGDELLLIPLKDNVADFSQYLTLNEVGAFIWDAIDQHDNAQTLCAKICDEFEADEAEVALDTPIFLQKLCAYLGIAWILFSPFTWTLPISPWN